MFFIFFLISYRRNYEIMTTVGIVADSFKLICKQNNFNQSNKLMILVWLCVYRLTTFETCAINQSTICVSMVFVVLIRIFEFFFPFMNLSKSNTGYNFLLYEYLFIYLGVFLSFLFRVFYESKYSRKYVFVCINKSINHQVFSDSSVDEKYEYA